MAVAFVASSPSSAVNGTAQHPTTTVTVSGTDPVLIVVMGLADIAESNSVTSVSWSLGSGTPVEVKTDTAFIFTANTLISVWAIPAPAAGAGTVTMNFSDSLPYQANAVVFSGADQTTPCPAADAVADHSTSTATFNLTALNVGSDDATFAGDSLTVAGNVIGVAPNETYLDNTTTVNLQAGYIIGPGNVAFTENATLDTYARVAVRIAAATAGAVDFTFIKPWMIA